MSDDDDIDSPSPGSVHQQNGLGRSQKSVTFSDALLPNPSVDDAVIYSKMQPKEPIDINVHELPPITGGPAINLSPKTTMDDHKEDIKYKERQNAAWEAVGRNQKRQKKVGNSNWVISIRKRI